MKVHWTNRAKHRLREIEAHIAENNPKAAKEQVERILRRSMLIALPPEIGRKIEHYENENLREILLRPWRIIYLRREKQIDIITILHYRQLLPVDLMSFQV